MFAHGIEWGDEVNFENIYHKTMDVNTLGVVRVTRKFIPLLNEAVGSRVIIISSVAG